MSATSSLTAELRAEVTALEADLRERLAILSDVRAAWVDEHRRAAAAERTGVSWDEWSAERITQAAVAWVLATVFVRFCEDNALIRPVWISGPRVRRQEALDAQAEFVRTESRRIDPATGEPVDLTDREWLRQAIDYFGTLPATAGLLDQVSPLWTISPSGDGALRLLNFWREQHELGGLKRDLHDPALETRFLGDVYQDLSLEDKSRYALLQTPVFVEEFILDRTLEPALKDRLLDGFRLIDPTCGSGHFLLGAFARLQDRWAGVAPALDERERVQRALDSIHGVDLNPFAVAIARFRLTVAALQASGLVRLEDAPAFRYHLAVGDSLLHGGDETLPLDFTDDPDAVLSGFAYSTEDLTALREILRPGRYDAVVGNPPYITVKDPALNKAYRKRYKTCKGTYAMTVPFMERFFELAKTGERAGWVGQITSNSFMKREFGAKLIEDFLRKKDLRLVADTSGAYIPGHGTPTVIIVGRPGAPVAATVRAVLGVRGEPGRPDDASKGRVWTSLVDHVDAPGWSDEWVTITDLDRVVLDRHPWSLTGGGAVELTAVIARSGSALSRRANRVGFMAMSHADQAFTIPLHVLRRKRLPDRLFPVLVPGDAVRDFAVAADDRTWFPYGQDGRLLKLDTQAAEGRWLWPLRTELSGRATFGGGTYARLGRPWFEWHQYPQDAEASEFSLVFAFVATHNHFVLDRGGKVFKQSAPVIKLPEGAGEDEHFALLGVLNSSIACFWLKQESHPKAGSGIGRGVQDEAWEDRYEFTGTTLQDFPLPASLPTQRGRVLDGLARRLGEQTPAAVCAVGVPKRENLKAAREEYDRIRAEMIAQQEELDWAVYRLYGLVEDDMTYGGDVPKLALGERAFEIVLARQIDAGKEQSAWFARHGSTAITEAPTHWPAAYRELVEHRIELAITHPYLRLLEKPEHKRRWATEAWEKKEERALRGWLLDRLEDRRFWFDGAGRPLPRSVAQLADEVSRDRELAGVLSLWEGRLDLPVSKSLARLLDGEAVPFLAAYRYKERGLRTRAAWEHAWALQRKEDAGTYDVERDGPILVPPNYTSADFTKVAYWSHRGKLDVPKERFVLYPAAGRDTDPTALLGWAGWDHAQQALALARLVQEREADGWDDARLVPLVAGLAELQPWLDQWHADQDPSYGGISAADYFRGELDTRSRQVGRTSAQLAAWRPAPARRGRPQRTTS